MMKSQLHSGLLALFLLPSSALLNLLASPSYPPALAPSANQLLKRQTTSPIGGVLDSLTKSTPSKASDSPKSDSSLADPSGPPPSTPSSSTPSTSPHDSTTPTPVSQDPSPAISSPLPAASPLPLPSSDTSKSPNISATTNAPSASPSPVPSKDSKDQKNSSDVAIPKPSNTKGSSNSSSSTNSTVNPSEPANTSSLPTNPTKPPARKSGDDNSSIGATTLKTMGIIAGVVAGIYLLWTIIRKWKFSPSKRFANKLEDNDDQFFEPRPPSFRENRPNAYYTPYQSSPSHAPSPYGAKYPGYMPEERLAGMHGPESLDGSEHPAGYAYGPDHNVYAARLSNSSLTTPSAVFESNHHRLSTAGLGNIQPNTHPYAYPPDQPHTHIV